MDYGAISAIDVTEQLQGELSNEKVAQILSGGRQVSSKAAGRAPIYMDSFCHQGSRLAFPFRSPGSTGLG